MKKPKWLTNKHRCYHYKNDPFSFSSGYLRMIFFHLIYSILYLHKLHIIYIWYICHFLNILKVWGFKSGVPKGIPFLLEFSRQQSGSSDVFHVWGLFSRLLDSSPDCCTGLDPNLSISWSWVSNALIFHIYLLLIHLVCPSIITLFPLVINSFAEGLVKSLYSLTTLQVV